jgi:hypothetical protein
VPVSWRASGCAFFAACVLAAACGDVAASNEVDGAAGTAGSTGGTAGSAGGIGGNSGSGASGGINAVGGSSTGGSGGSAGLDAAAGRAGAGHAGAAQDAATDAPVICEDPSCVRLFVDGAELPRQHVSLRVVASQFIGAIDRWIFDFTWRHDDPRIGDDEVEVQATIALVRLGFEPNAQNATFFYPDAQGNPLELRGGVLTQYGGLLATFNLAATTGDFSIRREADRFIGSVHMDFAVQGGPPSTVTVSGPFDVPVPQ